MNMTSSNHAGRRWPSWLWVLLLRARLTGPGRALHPHATSRGWRVDVTWRGIRLTQGTKVIWVRLEDVYQILLNLDLIADRAVFHSREGKQIADLRGEAQYLVTQTGDRIWLDDVVRLHELVEGYEGRGGPTEGQVVFDGGAFRGEFSLVASRRVGPRGRVIAFEPDAKNRAALERSLRENDIQNVTICPCGLWRETTTLEFAAHGDTGSCVATLDRRPAPSLNVRVPMLGWADAVAQFGAPDFVKMDIEGAEIEVIESAGPWLESHAVRFAIASYHRREGEPTWKQLEPMFRAHGYMAETGYPQHVTTWAWRA